MLYCKSEKLQIIPCQFYNNAALFVRAVEISIFSNNSRIYRIKDVFLVKENLTTAAAWAEQKWKEKIKYKKKWIKKILVRQLSNYPRYNIQYANDFSIISFKLLI